MAPRKHFALFRYFNFSAHVSSVLGLELRLGTPLFDISFGILAREIHWDAHYVGFHVYLLPTSWRFMVEEGSSFYRYHKLLGWRFGTEFLRAISWRIEQLILPPKCFICGERVRVTLKPFCDRAHWQHASCANRVSKLRGFLG